MAYILIWRPKASCFSNLCSNYRKLILLLNRIPNLMYLCCTQYKSVGLRTMAYMLFWRLIMMTWFPWGMKIIPSYSIIVNIEKTTKKCPFFQEGVGDCLRLEQRILMFYRNCSLLVKEHSRYQNLLCRWSHHSQSSVGAHISCNKRPSRVWLEFEYNLA